MRRRGPEVAISSRLVALRAADLKQRVQALGHGLGDAAHLSVGPLPVPLGLAGLVEILRPWTASN